MVKRFFLMGIIVKFKGCFVLGEVVGEALSEKGAWANVECEELFGECAGIDTRMRLGLANSVV